MKDFAFVKFPHRKLTKALNVINDSYQIVDLLRGPYFSGKWYKKSSVFQ